MRLRKMQSALSQRRTLTPKVLVTIALVAP